MPPEEESNVIPMRPRRFTPMPALPKFAEVIDKLDVDHEEIGVRAFNKALHYLRARNRFGDAGTDCAVMAYFDHRETEGGRIRHMELFTRPAGITTSLTVYDPKSAGHSPHVMPDFTSKIEEVYKRFSASLTFHKSISLATSRHLIDSLYAQGGRVTDLKRDDSHLFVHFLMGPLQRPASVFVHLSIPT
jgi:hypothetical protein